MWELVGFAGERAAILTGMGRVRKEADCRGAALRVANLILVVALVKGKEMGKSNDVLDTDEDIQLLRAVIPLWYAEMAWAKELLKRAFELNDAQEIMRPEFRGRRQIPGTTWFFRTHGIGVDVFRTSDVGGIDFDFDKLDPDSWRLAIFLEKQVNDGSLSYEKYGQLIDDEDRLKVALDAIF